MCRGACLQRGKRKHFGTPYSTDPSGLSSLAQAELYIAIATVFSTFDFELHETDESDVELVHAYLVPYPKWDSKGVRARTF